MPLYKVDIEKALATETWTNVYYCNAPDVEQGIAFMDGLVNDLEVTIHTPDALITRGRLSDLTPGSEVYSIKPYGVDGNRITTGTRLPLFNVARVDMPVAVGRPSRKYYRLPLHEGDIVADELEPALTALLSSRFAAWTAGIPAGVTWTDVDGQPITGYSPRIQVGMRQLRRGSRRRAAPVLG